MCTAKTPKVTTPKEKELSPLRNPYLDGIDPIVRSRQTGMSALRIDRGSTRPSTGITRPTTPTYSPPPSSVDPKMELLSKFPGALGRLGTTAIKRKETAA